ncbi:hypothetical protein Plec18167_001885 [Paecilomyces lecythidis]|uniref:PNPLA domain-containing protein n=1 Tax=Paecilomyces lecythidis TaxID=3004212 RepID=A0ABR3YAS8_9EURO
MITSSLSASQVHKRNLHSQRKFWGLVKSNKTCLWCLRRHPENPQSCGHTICDTCVEIFGKSSPHAESEYIISDCMLCDSSKGLTVRLKPPTAAARILSIDGGGLRAVIPLENLEILQEAIGPDLSLVDLFDLSVGTSSGGLIVLSMRILQMGVSQCKMLFRSLAKDVLSSTRRKKFLSFWLSDGAYDTGVLEDVLKEHFHPSRRLFDAPASLLSSGKVAVTASSISDGSLFIFTNYNGTAPHRAEPAYQRLRPDAEDEPYVWQVARATAAAPPLFSTIDIPGLGAFQDGGMGRHNNPVNVALSEARHLWPDDADPDVVVTLGTGSETASQKLSQFRNVVMDGWVPRLYRSMKSSFDGHATWREVMSRLDDGSQKNFFRFDTFLPNGLPAMDNTKCMDDLSSSTRRQSGENYGEAALSLLTSCLFFRLERVPEYQNGLFHCIGTIRCRAPARSLIKRLVSMEPEQQGFYKDNLNLGLQLSADDICQVCHRYSLPVRFFVRSLEETMTLSLRLGVTARRLSAFPSSIQWFVDKQGLNCAFGSSNHGTPFELDCPACGSQSLSRGRKRKYVEI